MSFPTTRKRANKLYLRAIEQLREDDQPIKPMEQARALDGKFVGKDVSWTRHDLDGSTQHLPWFLGDAFEEPSPTLPVELAVGGSVALATVVLGVSLGWWGVALVCAALVAWYV